MILSDNILIGPSIAYRSEDMLDSLRKQEPFGYPVWYAVTTAVEEENLMYILSGLEMRHTFYLKSNKLITGINDIGTNEIKVYPDGKNIMITGTEELVEIYNISGQLIYKGKEHQITVPNQGVYLVKAEGKVTKVLIQ